MGAGREPRPGSRAVVAVTRVLQVMAGAEHGGAETFFTRLVLALHGAGLEQRAVIRRQPERAAALRAAGVETVELPFGGFLDWRTGRALGREIVAFRPRLVLTWMNRATCRCPAGAFVHAARLGGYYELKHYRRCHHLIGNTRDIVDYLVREGWPRERAHHLPNFAPRTRAAPVARGDLATPEGAPLLLALGRLHRNKAFDVLLAALAQVPEAHLWLAGEGPLRGALEAEARRLGIDSRIRFLGWRDDTAALFAAADLLVCPSRHEPLGNVVIEAWAQGVPVIAAASAGPRALVADGANGLLVPVDDAAALAGAIRRGIADSALRERLRRGGTAAYEAEFTEDAVVRRYLDFFARVTA